MKANTVSTKSYYACSTPGASRYPNAADRKDLAHRIVDGILAAAITLAAVLCLVVLVTL